MRLGDFAASAVSRPIDATQFSSAIDHAQDCNQGIIVVVYHPPASVVHQSAAQARHSRIPPTDVGESADPPEDGIQLVGDPIGRAFTVALRDHRPDPINIASSSIGYDEIKHPGVGGGELDRQT